MWISVFRRKKRFVNMFLGCWDIQQTIKYRNYTFFMRHPLERTFLPQKKLEKYIWLDSKGILKNLPFWKTCRMKKIIWTVINFSNLHLGQKSPWTKVSMDKSLLGLKSLEQGCPWTTDPWTNVAKPCHTELVSWCKDFF